MKGPKRAGMAFQELHILVIVLLQPRAETLRGASLARSFISNARANPNRTHIQAQP